MALCIALCIDPYSIYRPTGSFSAVGAYGVVQTGSFGAVGAYGVVQTGSFGAVGAYGVV
jgi:hypothetical protein